MRERALAASQHLRTHLKEQLPKETDKLEPVRLTLIPECIY